MDIEQNLEWMSRNAGIIKQSLEGVSAIQAKWRPDPEAWSLLEVIHHLYDEEREDFRVRIEHILEKRAGPWPGIDPAGWVTARKYNEKDLQSCLRLFLDEREKSIRWLRTLEDPDWDMTYEAPFGLLKCGDIFAAWVAHDLLHIRQLSELHWSWTSQALMPFSVRYAGEW